MSRIVNLKEGTLTMTVSSESIPKAVSEKTENEEAISVRANIVEELEENCQKKRTEVVKPDGFLISPLHVLKTLSEEFNTPIHSEVFMINHNIIGGRIWRVETYVGESTGVGQAPTRPLAFQMAAVDLLEKIQLSQNEIKLQPYGLWPGCRVPPSVYKQLNHVCKLHDLNPAEFILKQSKENFEDQLLFEAVCQIGNLVKSAKSDCRFMAKRLAAREMLQVLTNEPLQDMHVALGNDCIGLDDLRSVGITALISSQKKKWMEANGMVNGTNFSSSSSSDDDEEAGNGHLNCMGDAFVNMTMTSTDEDSGVSVGSTKDVGKEFSPGGNSSSSGIGDSSEDLMEI